MENELKDKINKFLQIDNGSGYGYGYGFGSGSGYDDGSGYGYNSGYGYGFGDGDGDGSGSGSGDGIQIFNNYKIYFIDGIQTIIKSIFKGVAKGFILNSDLSLHYHVFYNKHFVSIKKNQNFPNCCTGLYFSFFPCFVMLQFTSFTLSSTPHQYRVSL